MDPVLLAVLLGLFCIWAPVAWLVQQEQENWQTLADELHLVRTAKQLHGSYHEHPVRVWRRPGNIQQVVLEVTGLPTGPLTLGPRAMQLNAVQLRAAQDLNARLEAGVLTGWFDRAGRPLDAARIRQHLDQLVSLANALCNQGPIDELLLDSLRRERDGTRRLALAQALLARGDHHRDPVADELLANPDPLLRLAALRFLSVDHPSADWVLTDLLHHWEASVRTACVRFCVDHGVPVVRWVHLLEDDDLEVLRVTLNACRRVGHVPLDVLVGLAEGRLSKPHDALVPATVRLARLLGEGDEACEAPLLTLLDRWRDKPVLEAVFGALGRVGTVQSVEPLSAHANNLFGPGRDAQAAIDAIQARIQGEVGSLSVAEVDGDAGGLSLTSSEGHLSVPEGEP